MKVWKHWPLIVAFGLGWAFSRGSENRISECHVTRRKDRAVVHFEGYEFAVKSQGGSR